MLNWKVFSWTFFRIQNFQDWIRELTKCICIDLSADKKKLLTTKTSLDLRGFLCLSQCLHITTLRSLVAARPEIQLWVWSPVAQRLPSMQLRPTRILCDSPAPKLWTLADSCWPTRVARASWLLGLVHIHLSWQTIIPNHEILTLKLATVSCWDTYFTWSQQTLIFFEQHWLSLLQQTDLVDAASRHLPFWNFKNSSSSCFSSSGETSWIRAEMADDIS